MIKACVIGWPIAHSRSPLIHGYWLKQYGLEGSYERLAVPPADLGTFFQRLRAGEFVGCNVTLPHKETALSFATKLTAEASSAGSLNTIYREGAELVGTCTDGSGFAENVSAYLSGFSWAGKSVLLLGAGGSARAIAAELIKREVATIAVWNRTAARARAMSRWFSGKVKPISWDGIRVAGAEADVIINTTSAGLAGSPPLEFPFQEMASPKIVADIVYVPLVTRFLQSAEASGHTTVPGLGMLLHQAVPGFEKWFGKRPEVTQDLYDLVVRDIEKGMSS
jgi:shikimate dehydrogenase